LHASERLNALDGCRGLAALAVAWYHFTNTGPFAGSGALSASGRYGYLGVVVFFVISATVIPLSLARASYSLRGFPRFFAKRLVRLEPPYLVSIALILALNWLSSMLPGYRGTPFAIDWTQVALHLGYLNAFVDPAHGWLNIVFWTLAVEFQLYLVLGLALPWAASPVRRQRWLFLAAFCAPAFVFTTDSFAFHYAFVFALGIALFQSRAGLVDRREFLVRCALASAGAVLTVGAEKAAAALVTVAIADRVALRGRALAALGAMSYSVYLLHVPVGGRVINLATRWDAPPSARWAICFAAAAVTLGAAWVFYRLVERPAMRLASRIAYRPQDGDVRTASRPEPELEPSGSARWKVQ
jgi:peptidoglycan/LPS O-acetylase OafA/YrhL